MKIKDIIVDFIIMPQTIKPMGLIHKPGKGPNNRFGFRNVGNNKVNEKQESQEQWEAKMIKKYGEDRWYDIQDSIRDYYESNAILQDTISNILAIRNEHPSFTDFSGITKLYRYVKKDTPPTDEKFIPFAYNIKGAKNFVQSMMRGNMGFKKGDFVLVEKDFKPQDAIINFTNMIEWVHYLEGDDDEWYRREYEVWMKRTPYYIGENKESVKEGVGIITPQNTTVDVKPGEVHRQANKLALKVNNQDTPMLHGEVLKDLERRWNNGKNL